jgi:hypothetical protein
MIVPSVVAFQFTSPRSFRPVSHVHPNPFVLLRHGLPEGHLPLAADWMTLGAGPASQYDRDHLRTDVCSRTMARIHFSPVRNRSEKK